MCCSPHVCVCLCVCTYLQVCGACAQVCVEAQSVDISIFLSQFYFLYWGSISNWTQDLVLASLTSQLASGILLLLFKRAPCYLALCRFQRSELYPSCLPWRHFIHWSVTAETCHLPQPGCMFFLMVCEEVGIGTQNNAATYWIRMTVSGPNLCIMCILLHYILDSL